MNLKQYKYKYKLKSYELAKRFKVCNATVTNWIKGTHTPVKKHQTLIHKQTHGEVTYADWKKYDHSNSLDNSPDCLHPCTESNEE